jgi:hypothetical protein
MASVCSDGVFIAVMRVHPEDVDPSRSRVDRCLNCSGITHVEGAMDGALMAGRALTISLSLFSISADDLRSASPEEGRSQMRRLVSSAWARIAGAP